MKIVCAVSIIVVVLSTTQCGNVSKRQTKESNEFDYRRFGGYPVHIGNGKFRFLGIYGDPAEYRREGMRTSAKKLSQEKTNNGEKERSMKKQNNLNLRSTPKDSKRPKTPIAPMFILPSESIPYTKVVLQRGDGTHFPKRGNTVEVWYKGMFLNGKVFDSNIPKRVESPMKPLKFRVGMGLVIRGWDETLLTMSVGEKARVIIHPKWAYGKEGAGRIPPNTTVVFEIKLISIK